MSSPADVFRRRVGQRPFLLGHRGARHAAPENTLQAFELARQEGADGVELDVRLDGSGRVIVLHDPTLSRVTQSLDMRHAEQVPREEFAKIEVGAGEHVPLLSDVLEWARRHDMRVNVELKADVRDRRRLLEGVRDVLRSPNLPLVVLSSFDPRFVRWLGRELPDLPRAWLVHHRQRVLKYAPGWRLFAHGVHPEHVLATPERVSAIHADGGFVNVWTVNDVARALRLAEAGVDGIISDTPGAILGGLAALNAPSPPAQ